MLLCTICILQRCVSELQDNAKTMKVQLDAQVKAVDQLKGNTRMLENKLSEAKSKKDTLKARAKSASTSKQINEMLQGLNTSSASSAFDRMEEKVMALEGESDAAMQVTCTHARPLGLTCLLLSAVSSSNVLAVLLSSESWQDRLPARFFENKLMGCVKS